MKKFLQIFSVLLLSCISVVAIGMAKPQLARADKIPSAFATNGKQDPVECEWKNTAKIHCNLIASSVGATYSLAVESSATAGHLVFAADDVRPRDEADKDYGFIHFSNETTFNDLTISTNSQNPEGGAKVISVSGDEIPISGKPEDTDRPNVCSITNLVVGCKNGYIQPYEKATESKATADQMATVKTIYKEGKAAQGPSKCEADAGALGFFLCPLSDMVTGVVKWALDIFTSLLELPPLAADNKDLTDAVDSIRNIANAFYVIIFLIIIFANFIAIPGLDNYSVKKLLPKLITVIILTQFSYLICSVMVDLGNIAGQTIPLAIATAADGDEVAKTEGLNEWIAAELLNPINDINDNLGGDIEDSKAGAAKAGAATAGVALTGVALYFFGFIIVLVAAVIIIISLFYGDKKKREI